MPVPVITPAARAAGLVRAAETRHARAEIRHLLKTGKATLPAVLADAATDPVISGMRVRYLLESMPRYGPATAARVMAEVKIPPGRRVRGLGPRQLQALQDAIGEAHGRHAQRGIT